MKRAYPEPDELLPEHKRCRTIGYAKPENTHVNEIGEIECFCGEYDALLATVDQLKTQIYPILRGGRGIVATEQSKCAHCYKHSNNPMNKYPVTVPCYSCHRTFCIKCFEGLSHHAMQVTFFNKINVKPCKCLLIATQSCPLCLIAKVEEMQKTMCCHYFNLEKEHDCCATGHNCYFQRIWPFIKKSPLPPDMWKLIFSYAE